MSDGGFVPKWRVDEYGVWDLQPPGAKHISGDYHDEEGVWRQRKPKPRGDTPKERYEIAADNERLAREKLESREAKYPADDPNTIRLREILSDLSQHRRNALAAYEKWQADGLDPELNPTESAKWDTTTTKGRKARWNDIDADRRTFAGRHDYNKRRRTVRERANMNLLLCTPEEKKERKREQDREAQRRKREKAKAAKAAAAASGDLSAAIS